MYWISGFLRGVDWNSAPVIVLTALLMTLAITRKWFLLAMSLLVITLARGLGSLQVSCAAMPNDGFKLATLVYVAGSIIVITFAAVEFFVKE